MHFSCTPPLLHPPTTLLSTPSPTLYTDLSNLFPFLSPPSLLSLPALSAASKKGSKKDSGRKRKVRAKKDPNAPKRAMSAYILFSNDHRAQVKEEKPDMKFGEIARELADRWKNASPKDKEVRALHSAPTPP